MLNLQSFARFSLPYAMEKYEISALPAVKVYCKSMTLLFSFLPQDAGDAPTMAGLVSYLTNVGPGASDDHPIVGSFFWWAWNPTSGDTKGMVLDNWLDIDWLRIDFMSRGLLGGSILPSNLGLRPWYMR